MGLLLIAISFMSSAMAANEPGPSVPTDLSEELRVFSQDKPYKGWSYNGEFGFTEVACEPSVFKKQIEKAMQISDAAKQAAEMQAVCASYGFSATADLISIGYTTAELTGLGNVPAPWGQARITLVKVYGGGISLYFVFLKKENDWFLTDCLRMDYWEADVSYPYPELMLHWAGKPGAWLVTRSVGHGTGVYIDCRQWYNVFTRQFDLSYTLEGFDSTLETDGWYYAGWETKLGFTSEEVSDVLRFVTYEGMVKDPYDAPGSMGDEIISAMVLHEYQYDPDTASYRSTREERLPLMSPGSVHASGFLRERQ